MIKKSFLTWNTDRIYSFLIKICIFCSILEFIAFPSWETLYYICISLIGCFLLKKYIFTAYNLVNYTVSTLAISFYILFFFVMPMPATLLEFKPVIYNLHNPIYTFTQLLLLEITLIITHLIYKKITNRKNFIRDTLIKCNFFTKFSSSEIWILFLVSFIIYTYTIFTRGLYDENSKNTAASLPIGMYIMNLLFGGFYQIIILFYFRKFNIIKQPYTIHNGFIFFFVACLFIIGIATNMRTASVLVFANLFFLFIVYIIYIPFNFKYLLKLHFIIPVIIIIFFFFGPFMKISKAMVANRGDRNGLNGIEILEKTLNSIEGINKLQEQRILESTIIWDEEYLSNDILNRFCSLKLLDETLYHAERIGYANEKMQKDLQLKIIDNFPSIIKENIGYRIPDDIRYSSLTDRLYSLSVKSKSLGGIKIGTLQGLGLAIFGHYYPLIIIPLFIIIFFFLDATILYRKNRMFFSLWFFSNILLCCYYFSDRHYYLYEFRFITRTYFESIFFYIVTIYIIKRIPYIKH